jgi:hypothetical protein
MKKVVTFILLVVILASCGTQTAEVIPSEEPESNYSVSKYPPAFPSEEEFVNHVLEVQNGIRDESCEYFGFDEFFVGISHYYKFKNPPPDAIIHSMSVGPIVVVYDTQKPNVGKIREHMMIQYYPDSLYPPFDIEEDGGWAWRPFPDESYVFEKNGIKYYIRKGTGLGETILLWGAEWVNEDGYYMKANFPSRFTAEEVLGYISDLERVEIR